MEASALVIALDGPSGAGKSSVARAVARSLGLRYLDTGAMYRGLTWWMLRHDVDVSDPGTVAAVTDKPQLVMDTSPDSPAVHVDGVDVSVDIRARDVSNAVSAVSAVPDVRRRMVAQQAEIIEGSEGIVVEGRDIGTTVAPEAPVKIFLTATAEERAQRRTRELAEGGSSLSTPSPSGQQVTRDATHAEMQRRDRLDTTRITSPLAVAADAVEVDSTGRTLDEVVEMVLRLVREPTEAL